MLLSQKTPKQKKIKLARWSYLSGWKGSHILSADFVEGPRQRTKQHAVVWEGIARMWIPFGFAICRRPKPHLFGGNQGSAAEDDEPHSVWEKPPQTTDSQMQEHLFSHLGLFWNVQRVCGGPSAVERTLDFVSSFLLQQQFIRASRLLIEATCRPEKPSREIKMRLGRKQNPFLVQTQGKVQTGNISHHSSKYTLVCHVAEVLSQAGQNH